MLQVQIPLETQFSNWKLEICTNESILSVDQTRDVYAHWTVLHLLSGCECMNYVVIDWWLVDTLKWTSRVDGIFQGTSRVVRIARETSHKIVYGAYLGKSHSWEDLILFLTPTNIYWFTRTLIGQYMSIKYADSW